MHVHQFVHTLNYGDAISGEALAIDRLLNEMGVESKIYVVNAHKKVANRAHDWRNYESEIKSRRPGEDVLVVLHYSIASPLNQLFKELGGVRKTIIYHNLTPERWFLAYNARVAADVRKARHELAELAASADTVLADSEFNLSELQALDGAGSNPGAVLPLLLDEEKWKIPANPGIRAVLNGHGGVNVLHVGRLAPNKCLEDIIKPFYFYHHKINRKSRLWLIGSDIDTEVYSFELRRLVSELRLREAVTFVGAVADSELRSFYENSHLYLCMSEHEGFCVPLLEAMHFGVPIIAYDACAVKETLGSAGILLAQKDPALVAELMDEVVSNVDLRGQLLENGRRRAREFGLENFTRVLTTHLLEDAPALRARAGSI